MADASEALEAGLFDALNVPEVLALATGGIHDSIPPAGVKPPYVIYQAAPGVMYQNANPSDLVEAVYMVKAVATSKAIAMMIVERLHGALHDQTLSVAGFTNYSTRREEGIALTETDEAGQRVYHRGFYLRVRLDS